MRFFTVLLLMLALTATAHGQVPRPPGWQPVPPGALTAAVQQTEETYGALPVPVFGQPASVDPVKEEEENGDHRISVRLPEDATLYIDDQPVRQQSGRLRTFLTRYRTGQYTMRAEVRRGNVIYRSTRYVPASDSDVSFDELEQVGRQSYQSTPVYMGAGDCSGGT